jgi:hypothetical protein
MRWRVECRVPRTPLRKLRILPILLPLAAACSGDLSDRAEFARDIQLERFLKGNTHTHTERSFDSTAPIADVLGSYRQAGYGFVVITDHDKSAVPGEFFASETPGFVVIAGEEITSYGFDPTGPVKLVHVNSICSNGSTVGGVTLGSVALALTDAVNRAVDVAGALAQINHPNLDYGLHEQHILQANRAHLIEIANQYPGANNAGDETHASTEQLWDEVLTAGMTVYGTASDDTHDVAPGSSTPPGRGWVQVAADRVSAEAVCDALRNGRFYASTGVALSRIAVTRTRMQLQIEPRPGTQTDAYVTTFIGSGGRTLAQENGLRPSYGITGDEGYVRATITGPAGETAWVQPAFVVQR